VRRLATAGAFAALLLVPLTAACDKGSAPPDPAGEAQAAARVSKGIAPQIGYTAPDFELTDLEGRMHRLSDLRGQVVLLNFWATWCGPCRIEMPTLQAMHEDYGGADFALLAVAGDLEGAQVVRPFIRRLGLTFPALLDARGDVQDQYFVNALPMSFLLDRHGVVVYKLVGFFDWNQPRFRGMVEGLMNEA
jgi:peroxiredoxin